MDDRDAVQKLDTETAIRLDRLERGREADRLDFEEFKKLSNDRHDAQDKRQERLIWTMVMLILTVASAVVSSRVTSLLGGP